MSRVVVLETVRRHFTSVLVVAFVLVLAMLGLISARFDTPGSLWPGFLTLLTIGAGAGLIGPEFSSGTLQLILVKPINRATYLLSRWAGVVLVIWIAGAIAFACEAGARLLAGTADKIGVAATALAGTACEALLICALLTFFGTFLRAYFNVALYFLLQIVFGAVIGILSATRMARSGFGATIAAFVREHPEVPKAITWLETNIFPERPASLDRQWVLMIFCNTAIALALACVIFRRREVPYGAD